MRVQVYKCRFTSKLFPYDEKDEYIAHLKKLRKEKKLARELKRIKDEFKTWLDNEKKKLIHVDMIAPWFLANQKYIMKAYSAMQPKHSSFDKFFDTDEFVKLELEGLRYNDLLSNTHRCPHNGVTNWGGKEKLKNGRPAPRGYRGFGGHVSASLKREKKHTGNYPVSDLLNFIDLHTGGGGGGNEHCGYAISIFLDDWPGLKKQVAQMKRTATIDKKKADAEAIIRRLKGFR